ncbi:phage terminase small subunit P27 family, partial [Escherichia coli]
VADLAARGFSIVNSQGGESRNPALSAKSDAERVMIKMASLLGFVLKTPPTPSYSLISDCGNIP